MGRRMRSLWHRSLWQVGAIWTRARTTAPAAQTGSSLRRPAPRVTRAPPHPGGMLCCRGDDEPPGSISQALRGRARRGELRGRLKQTPGPTPPPLFSGACPRSLASLGLQHGGSPWPHRLITPTRLRVALLARLHHLPVTPGLLHGLGLAACPAGQLSDTCGALPCSRAHAPSHVLAPGGPNARCTVAACHSLDDVVGTCICACVCMLWLYACDIL